MSATTSEPLPKPNKEAKSEPLPKPSKEAKRRAVLRELQWVLAAMIVLLILLIPTLVLVRQHTNSGLLKNVDNTNRVIVDCTTPAGKCYQDGQKNQNVAIGKIELIVVLAASCAKQPQNQTVRQISDCVEAGLR